MQKANLNLRFVENQYEKRTSTNSVVFAGPIIIAISVTLTNVLIEWLSWYAIRIIKTLLIFFTSSGTSRTTTVDIGFILVLNSILTISQKYITVTAREPRPISQRTTQLHPQIHLRHAESCRACCVSYKTKFLVLLNVFLPPYENRLDKISAKTAEKFRKEFTYHSETFQLHQKISLLVDQWVRSTKNLSLLAQFSHNFRMVYTIIKTIDCIRPMSVALRLKIPNFYCYLQLALGEQALRTNFLQNLPSQSSATTLRKFIGNLHDNLC